MGLLIQEQEMREAVVKEDMVKDWLESGDEVMVDLAKGMVGNPPPSVDEAVDILRCFVTFSVGCAQVGLKDLAEKYGRRADLFVLGLRKMGYGSGYLGGFYPEMRERAALDKIILRACSGIKLFE